MARTILYPVSDAQPEPRLVVAWGVGPANSDVELLELYSSWAEHSEELHVVNPSKELAERAKELFPCQVR